MNANLLLQVLFQVLSLVKFVADKYPEVKEDYDSLNNTLKKMLEENRDPTREEITALRVKTASLNERIRSMIKE
jgi:ElaB/YqjD/DUF883 family membrane-anchored ribosome-binding protein